MDGDGQNDPADIPRLIDKLKDGYDVVSGWRRDRQDPFWTRRLPSQVANALISWITGVHLHDYGCALKVYRREILQDIALYGEMHRFLPGAGPVGRRDRGGAAGRPLAAAARRLQVRAGPDGPGACSTCSPSSS